MAWSIVQFAQAQGVAPRSITLPSAIPAGDLIVAVIKRNNIGAIGVTDGVGTAFTDITGSPFVFNGGTAQVSILTLIAGASQNLTFTTGTGGTLFFGITHISGNATTSFIGGTPVTFASTVATANSNNASNNITTTDAGSLIFTALALASASAAPFTNTLSTKIDEVSAAIPQLDTGYTVPGAISTYLPYVTWSGSRMYGQVSVEFLPLATPTTSVTYITYLPPFLS